MNAAILRSSLILALAFPFAAVADEDDDDRFCDYVDGQYCQQAGCFDAKYQKALAPLQIDGYCEYESINEPDARFFKFLPSQAPTPSIQCVSTSNCELQCTAQPEGAGLTYQWTRQGPSAFNPVPGPYDNQVSVTLFTPNSVTIRVAVVSPYGQSDTVAWGVIPYSACFPD